MRLVMAPFLGLILMTAGCDRQSAPAPQAKESAKPADEQEDAGVLDRSHKGEAMSDKAFEDPHGARVTLSDFKGKPLLVNLWATWCGPCVAEMPTLDALAETNAATLQLIVVSQDMKGREQVDPWWAKRSFKRLKPYIDAKADLSFAFGDGTLPTTVLYDADGKEVWRVIGAMNWSGAKAAGLIGKATGG